MDPKWAPNGPKCVPKGPKWAPNNRGPKWDPNHVPPTGPRAPAPLLYPIFPNPRFCLDLIFWPSPRFFEGQILLKGTELV